MVPFTFEVITVITLTVIGTIMALYLIVLKRQGWLTENSSKPKDPNKSFYLCPNRECKQVFEEPIKVTDLARSSGEIYLACPHCKSLLGDFPGSSIKPKPNTPTPKNQLWNFGRNRTPSPPIETTQTFTKPIRFKPVQESSFASSVGKSKDVKPVQESSFASGQSSQRKPGTCSRFFGYLATIPKNTSIPDECYGCLKMLECLVSDVSDGAL